MVLIHKSYEQRLLEKKEKLENLLANEMERLDQSRRWLKETQELKPGDEDYPDKGEDTEIFERIVEAKSLITEALEDSIYAIDQYLKDKSAERMEKEKEEESGEIDITA